MMHTDRRYFLAATGSAFAALAAAGCAARGGSGLAALPAGDDYGDLIADSASLLDLPRGFSYRVLSSFGDAMNDGGTVPDQADGMGCFAIGNGEWALVRNHELTPQQASGGASGPAYDTVARSLIPLPGGTTTVVLDTATLAVKRQYRSLAGTIRNCAGGVTPWGSWLTCEEDVSKPNGRINRDHGYVFEVPANAERQVEAVPLTAMGRFNHEAACVDPASGIVYMTEDRDEGLLYRFIPTAPGKLSDGGTLQALALAGIADTRNRGGVPAMETGQLAAGHWITLDNPQAPDDDLRARGAAAGAALFARGEGVWMGEDELYFTATSGGAERQGQIFRLVPGADHDVLELFYESPALAEFSFGDNITIAPDGHLIVCEDQYTPGAVNYLRGITPTGAAYAFARVRVPSETAGACFSPDGRTLFLNVYSPAKTLAITGPWKWL